jgi:hypothetical protein
MPRLNLFHSPGWNEPVDYCQRCYPKSERAAYAIWGDDAYIDMDNEHPDYDADAYKCESCGRQLAARDN